MTSPLKVSPYHLPGATNPVMYAFHGICEHMLARPCEGNSFVIVGDFLMEDLSTGRVGLQYQPDVIVIIDEDLQVITENVVFIPPIRIDGDDEITEYTNGLTVTRTNSSGTLIRVTISVPALGIRIERDNDRIGLFVNPEITGELCGLCGNASGILVSSDGMIVNDLADQYQIDRFADSWQREPRYQILREDRRDCGMLCIKLISALPALVGITPLR